MDSAIEISNDQRPNQVLNSHPSLVCVEKAGANIDLVKEITVVGRDGDCDVKLDDKRISKLHCVFVCKENSVLVRDLHSTNGTRVNGKRIRRAAIGLGDVISIAEVRFELKIGCDEDISIREDNLPDTYPDAKTHEPASTGQTISKLCSASFADDENILIEFDDEESGLWKKSRRGCSTINKNENILYEDEEAEIESSISGYSGNDA